MLQLRKSDCQNRRFLCWFFYTLRTNRRTILHLNLASPSLHQDNDGGYVFPNLIRLASIVLSWVFSTADIERLFSILRVVKNKLRNRLAVPMVEAILMVRTSLTRKGQNSATFVPSQMMFDLFNVSMYDFKRVPDAPSTAAAAAAAADMDEISDEMQEVLRDVEELFGQPIFITSD